MINNIEHIKSLLNFDSKGDFYMLYVFKRKKDQPEGERDNHLITTRFDVMEFNKQMEIRNEMMPDIQKKNPTLLYYPNSLN